METEFSDRARHVTEQVSLWIQNDGDYVNQSRGWLQNFGVETFAKRLRRVLMDAPRHSAPWQVAQDLSPNDYNRIHWDDVAEAIKED